MYFRYFKVTSGPLIEELSKLKAIDAESQASYGKLSEEVGSTGKWVLFGTMFGGFHFDAQPDLNVWKPVPKYHGYYSPRRTSPSGKALAVRINAIPHRPDFNKALEVIGVSMHWITVDSNRMAHAGIVYLNHSDNTVFVSVPWRDVDPQKLADYKNKTLPDCERSCWGDSELEHFLWQPHESMIEVKEWELLKYKADHAAKVEASKS